MIVLDEQLLGRSLERKIAHWYRGAVCYITDLRPSTVIKDDVIPHLLQQENQPTFVTINEKDFWRKVAINERFCVVCFVLPDSRVPEVSTLLRSVLSHVLFKTKSARMGKVIRVSEQEVRYYTCDDQKVRAVDL